MWSNVFLSYLLFTPLVRAARRELTCKDEPPLHAQITTNTPHPTLVASGDSALQDACGAPCTLYLPQISVISWVPEDQIVYTADITIGVVRKIVYMGPISATAVRTVVDYRWPEVSDGMYPPLPTTDEYGTAFAITALSDADTTTFLHLAYPNTFTDYAKSYTWKGVLPTSDLAGTMSCATATDEPSIQYLSTVEYLSDHPLYPQPSRTTKNDSDTSTKRQVPLWVPLPVTPDGSFFETAFPSETALQRCTLVEKNIPVPTIYSMPRFFWNHSTEIVEYSPTVNCSRHPVLTGGLASFMPTQGAPYLNTSTSICGAPTVLTILVDGGGTSTMYGDGPHHQTQTRPPVTRIGERPHFEYRKSSWRTPTPTEPRTGYFRRPASRPAWLHTTSEISTRSDIRHWSSDGCYYEADETATLATCNRFAYLPTRQEPYNTNLVRLPPSYDFTQLRVARTQSTASWPGWTASDSRVGFLLSQIPGINNGWDDLRTTVATTPVDAVPEETEAQKFRSLDATEAALVAGFFSQLTQDRVKPASLPQRTRSPSRSGSAGDLVDPDALLDRQRENLSAKNGGLLIAPLPGSKVAPSDDVDAVRLAAELMLGPSATAEQRLPFTSIATVVNGISTTIPAYIVPGFVTIPAAHKILLNGSPTTLYIPDLLPTYRLITSNGVTTSAHMYIVSGRSLAAIGQTMNFGGRTTVLETPNAVFAQVPTTVNGVATMTPVYIIGGSSTASIGQQITVDGILTVLAAPSLVPTFVTITSDGHVGMGLAYVLSTSSIAKLGETITIGGSPTVLSDPSAPRVVEAGSAGGWRVSWNAAFVGICVFFVALL